MLVFSASHGSANGCDVCERIKKFVQNAVETNKENVQWLKPGFKIENECIEKIIEHAIDALTKPDITSLISQGTKFTPSEKNYIVISVFFNKCIREAKLFKECGQHWNNSSQKSLTFQTPANDAGVEQVFNEIKSKLGRDTPTTVEDVKKYCTGFSIYRLIKRLRMEVWYDRDGQEHACSEEERCYTPDTVKPPPHPPFGGHHHRHCGSQHKDQHPEWFEFRKDQNRYWDGWPKWEEFEKQRCEHHKQLPHWHDKWKQNPPWGTDK
jgi:hypothetical protein